MNSLIEHSARHTKPIAPGTVGSEFKWRDLSYAIALLAVFLLGLSIATVYPSGKNGQYLVVTPPWFSASQTMDLAHAVDGRIVDVGVSSNMLIIQSIKPGFIHTLYGAGAWLVLDPQQLRGCLGFQPPAVEKHA
jgi:hypothetical protein